MSLHTDVVNISHLWTHTWLCCENVFEKVVLYSFSLFILSYDYEIF